jgi:hypothetical protein
VCTYDADVTGVARPQLAMRQIFWHFGTSFSIRIQIRQIIEETRNNQQKCRWRSRANAVADSSIPTIWVAVLHPVFRTQTSTVKFLKFHSRKLAGARVTHFYDAMLLANLIIDAQALLSRDSRAFCCALNSVHI